MTRNQLIDQVSNGTPGGGNMPAYGKQMSPAEMDALVAFLVSLRPEGQPARRFGRQIASRRPKVPISDAAAMNPTLDAFLRSWPFAPWLAVTLVDIGWHLSARLAVASSP